jgi:starch synthase
MRILLLASEVAPFAKTGGLADVTGSLPQALAALGHEVRVVMPAYASIERAAASGDLGVEVDQVRLRVPFAGGLVDAGVFRARLPGSEVPVFFIAERNLFGRASIYGYDDDTYRFAFFSRAALDLMIAAWGWRPDVVHAHDWHAAPAVAWLATTGAEDAHYRDLPTVLTIHNLRHQGRGPKEVLTLLGARRDPIHEELPYEVNFMARGIHYATMITAVSPTYAREILTPEYGERMDPLLRRRSYDLHGILNGLDVEGWDPAIDTHLAATYDAGSVDRKAVNKRALQQRLGLPAAEVPLVSMVTRLDRQKGLDITGHVLHLLLNAGAGEAQFVVVGSGAPEYEAMLRRLASYHTQKMAAILHYDGLLAPLVYAASDLFLMPSLFEPCGLGQMFAMRYGAVPVVRATGGLADTVHEGETGFTFGPATSDAFWDAVQRALNAYRHDPAFFAGLRYRGMTSDFSWTTSARGYERVFQWAVSRVRGW